MEILMSTSSEGLWGHMSGREGARGSQNSVQHLEGARDRCMAFHVQVWVGVGQ